MYPQIHATKTVDFKPAAYPLTGIFENGDGETYEELLVGWESDGTTYEPVFADIIGDEAMIAMPIDLHGEKLVRIVNRFPRDDS